jgi:hypothetical protein
MNNLEVQLDGITEEGYLKLVNQITHLDPNKIDEELQKQASLYSWYHGLLALCKKKVREAESNLEVFESLARNDEYNRRMEEGLKATEKIMESYIKSLSEYRELVNTKIELETKYDLLKGIVTSLSHKKDSLIQMSSNARAEKNIYS